MAASTATADPGQMSNSRIVVRNTAVQMARYAAIWCANIALVLFLPRYLGAEGLGQLQFAISFVSLFAFLVALGTRSYIIKEIARDGSLLPSLLGTALGLRVTSAGIVVVIVAIVVESTGQSGVTRHVVYLAMAWMVLTSFSQLIAASLHGLERMTWVSFSEVASKIFVVAVGIPLLINGRGVLAYAGVMVLGAILHLAINSGYIARFARIRMDLHVRRMGLLAVRGGPYIIMGFLLAVYTNIDVVMIRFYTNDSVVGWHAAALQINRSVEFLPMVLTTAMLPTLSRMFAADIATVAPVARRGIAAVAIVMVPIGLGLSLVASDLIGFFPYPTEFSNSVPVLILMGLSVPITGFLTLLGTVAIAMDRQRAWGAALAVTVLLNVILNAFLIPYTQSAYGNGAIGAALTTVFTEFLILVFGVVLLRHIIFEKGLLITLAKLTVAVAGMGFAVVNAKTLGLGLWGLVAVGVIVFGALAFLLQVIRRSDLASIGKSIGSSKTKAPATQAQQIEEQ